MQKRDVVLVSDAGNQVKHIGQTIKVRQRQALTYYQQYQN